MQKTVEEGEIPPVNRLAARMGMCYNKFTPKQNYIIGKREHIMRKTLSAILILALILALLPVAFADFEPVEGTPYGIPLFETIDDIDFNAVSGGHSTRRLLDLVDNFEVKQDLSQDAQGQKMNMLIDDYYFLDDGQYVNYSEQTDKQYNMTSYQIFLYDKDDPYYYVKFPGGRNKFPAQAEYIDRMLDNTMVPFNTEYFDIDMKSAEEVDGLWVYQFDMTQRTDLDPAPEVTVTFTDCSLTLDPETSLIRGFAYHQVSDYADMVVSAEVNYNVDKEPDYTIKY